MFKRLALALLFAAIAFLVAAAGSYFMILAFSANTHDRSIEAAMTSLLICAPIAGLLGFLGGLIYGRRRADGGRQRQGSGRGLPL